jgi:hypothetical protein
MAKKVVKCLYCKGFARIIDKDDKKVLMCPKCGKMELTKEGFEKLISS